MIFGGDNIKIWKCKMRFSETYFCILILDKRSRRKHPYFSNDFFASAVELYLEKKVEVADDLDELLLYIENHFNINKDEHFLIFPLQGSGLNKDISFLNFHLLSKKNEAEILQQISEIT